VAIDLREVRIVTEQGKKAEFYDEREAMSCAEREEYYNKRLQRQVEYAYENTPAVRAKLDRVGVKPSDIVPSRTWRRYQLPRRMSSLNCGRQTLPGGDCWRCPPKS